MEPRNNLKMITAMILYLALTSVACASSGTDANRASGDIILWYRNYDSPAIRNLLKLALDKTPEYGTYTIVRSREMNQGRAVLDLEHDVRGVVDVANVASSPRRKGLLGVIPFPIDGGLLGYRVCLINEGDQKKFNNIRSVQDFRSENLRVGQGAHWPDTRIMRANGLKVVTNTEYNSLFAMLKRNRFDCFARGVNEVAFDLEDPMAEGLVIEQKLLFAYRMPSLFFVSPGNTALEQRLSVGFERAVMDGSFLKHFKRYYEKPVEKLNLSDRVVLPLGNPWISAEDNKSYQGLTTRMWQRLQFGEALTPPEKQRMNKR